MMQSPRAISAPRTSAIRSVCALALGLAWVASPAPAQQLDRASVTSRAQTAYLSEDAAGLGRL